MTLSTEVSTTTRLYRALKGLIPRWLINLTHWLRALAAVILYGYPAKDLTVIGITGTDGKTTTTHTTYTILKEAGHRTTLISSVEAIITPEDSEPTGLHVTTPSPFQLQRLLKKARDAGVEYVVLETTSHGLDQHRVWGCNYKIGAVTNITHEHLDYHRTYEAYLKAKAKLLRGVETSILNVDDASFEKLSKLADGKIVTYGLGKAAEISAENISYALDGMSFDVPALGESIKTQLTGDYNVQNMLAATCIALALGVDKQIIAAGLRKIQPPAGRLERVDEGQNFTMFVDFAHTSNSMEVLASTLRKVTEKKLIIVFGCAGERDPDKRYPMGKSAATYADHVVITAEDPRTEDLGEIMEEIARGCRDAGGVEGQSYHLVPDRTEAIAYAIQKLAQPGDVVVATGKAHEQSMCYGTTEHPWDEFAAVRGALAALKNGG